MTVLGIDIFNGNSDGYDFARVKSEGVSFVIHKASQGWPGGPGGWQDWKMVGALNRAEKAGVPVRGGYHWLLKGQGAAQAKNFYQSIQRVGGPLGYLCAVDVERNDWDQSLNPDTATLQSFLSEWDQLSQGQPIWIYLGNWYWGPYMGYPTAFSSRPLWVPAYYEPAGAQPIGQAVKNVTPPPLAGSFKSFGGWQSYTARQWTSRGLVSGNQSDCNYFPGSLADLQAYTVPRGGKPKPTPGGDVAIPLPTINPGTDTGHPRTVALFVDLIHRIQPGRDLSTGPLREQACKDFQAFFKVPGGADGICGQQTWAALLAIATAGGK